MRNRSSDRHSTSKLSFAIVTALGLLAILPSPLGTAQSFGDPKNSKVEVETKADGKNMQFAFKLKPNDGLVVTLDAPWKFEVKGHDGLNFAKTGLGKAEMDDKLPGFVLTTSETPKKAQGDLEYTLTSFVCTKEKTACYREVHKGTFNWKT